MVLAQQALAPRHMSVAVDDDRRGAGRLHLARHLPSCWSVSRPFDPQRAGARARLPVRRFQHCARASADRCRWRLCAACVQPEPPGAGAPGATARHRRAGDHPLVRFCALAGGRGAGERRAGRARLTPSHACGRRSWAARRAVSAPNPIAFGWPRPEGCPSPSTWRPAQSRAARSSFTSARG